MLVLRSIVASYRAFHQLSPFPTACGNGHGGKIPTLMKETKRRACGGGGLEEGGIE